MDSLEKNIINSSDSIKAEKLSDFGRKKYGEEKYASALMYFKKALSYNIIEGYEERQMGNYTNIGNCYLFLSAYDEAINYYFKALKINEKRGHKEDIAKSLNNIGNIYIQTGDYKTALDDYLLKSLKLLQQIGNELDISKSLNNIGMTYSNMGEQKKALDFFQKSLVIREKLGNKSEISSVINNIGYVYLETGKEDLAIKNFREAFDMCREVDDKLGMAIGFLNMAQFFYDKKEFAKALPHGQECLNISKEIQAMSMMSEAYKILSEIHTAMGQHNKSLTYYKLFFTFYDSLFNEQSNNHIADIKIIYETEKKEAEIEVKNFKISEAKKWNITLIIGILIVLLFSIIFFFQKVNLKRAFNVLVQKNLEILKSEKKESLGSFSSSVKSTDNNQIKYTNSAMSLEQKEVIFNLIVDAFENKKVYLKQDLSVRKLADDLKTNKAYISQVINERFHQNFNTFINEYRIKEARRLLSEKENWNLTIEAIANNVGFNSKSAFNTAFKKFTGITPSYFLDSVRTKKYS